MTFEHRYLIPDWPAPACVKACVTRREGGVSQGNFSSFNLGIHSGDASEHVLANRHQLREDYGWDSEPQWLKQVHGTHVVKASDSGEEQEGDAVWTDSPGLPCAILTQIVFRCCSVTVTVQPSQLSCGLERVAGGRAGKYVEGYAMPCIRDHGLAGACDQPEAF